MFSLAIGELSKSIFHAQDYEKSILLCFLSEDRNTVQGVLSLAKDADGKTTFEITDRYLSMRENTSLPFWDGGTWLGYFLALDKDILGTENGSPGIATRPAKNKSENSLTMRMECSTQQTGEIVFYRYTYVLSGGEVSYFYYEITHTEPIYGTVCYDVPDPVIPDNGSGSGAGAPTPAPAPNNILQIFNYLSGKALCVYNKLNSTSSGFTNIIRKFDGTFPVSHLAFKESSSLPSNINASTSPPSNYLITITLNSNNLNRPNLSIARTIIHETIHAEMFRKILSIINNGGNLDGITIQQWTNKLSNGDYAGIFDYYSRYGVNDMQHEQMAAHYITTISGFLAEMQPGLPQNIYNALAWEGLQGTVAWNSLSTSKKTEITNTINQFNQKGSENCN